MCWEDAEMAKSRLDEYKNIIVISINESHWEDRGPGQKPGYHFSGTVFRSFKGDWLVSEKIALVHYVDSSIPATWKTDKGGLRYVFTDEHTSAEISLQTADWGLYTPETERVLQMVLPPGGRR
jgi:hypothetical protein